MFDCVPEMSLFPAKEKETYLINCPLFIDKKQTLHYKEAIE